MQCFFPVARTAESAIIAESQLIHGRSMTAFYQFLKNFKGLFPVVLRTVQQHTRLFIRGIIVVFVDAGRIRRGELRRIRFFMKCYFRRRNFKFPHRHFPEFHTRNIPNQRNCIYRVSPALKPAHWKCSLKTPVYIKRHDMLLLIQLNFYLIRRITDRAFLYQKLIRDTCKNL